MQALINRPLMITIPHIRRQPMIILPRMRLDLSIAQKCESVVVSVADIVVFESRIFDRFQEMNRLVSVISPISISCMNNNRHKERGEMSQYPCSEDQHYLSSEQDSCAARPKDWG
jgi:hypothetical protein